MDNLKIKSLIANINEKSYLINNLNNGCFYSVKFKNTTSNKKDAILKVEFKNINSNIAFSKYTIRINETITFEKFKELLNQVEFKTFKDLLKLI